MNSCIDRSSEGYSRRLANPNNVLHHAAEPIGSGRCSLVAGVESAAPIMAIEGNSQEGGDLKLARALKRSTGAQLPSLSRSLQPADCQTYLSTRHGWMEQDKPTIG